MRYSIVTETYLPEINGVALTVQAKEQGLRLRGHEVEVIRPRQTRGQQGAAHELLVPGLPIPVYPRKSKGHRPSTSLRYAQDDRFGIFADNWYQSTLRVATMIAARIANSRPAPSTSALSSDTSRPYSAA